MKKVKYEHHIILFIYQIIIKMHINEKIQMSYDKYINKLIEEKNYSERIFYDQTDQEYFLVYSFGITITQETTSTYKIHICFQLLSYLVIFLLPLILYFWGLNKPQ